MERRPLKSSSFDRPRGLAFGAGFLALTLATASALLTTARPATALSEIKHDDVQVPGKRPQMGPEAPKPGTVPLPDPIQTVPPAQKTTPPGQDEPEQVEPAKPGEGSGNLARPQIDPTASLPPVQYDLAKLPEPVRRMRDLIIEACKSGDIEKLRPLIGIGDSLTQLSLTDIEGDPIAFLKGLSGDTEGQEILAILQEVLDAGYVQLDPGTPQELYVWPYFFAYPLAKLDAKQRVELFKIVTAGDYEDMKQYGTYIFYRVGITPQGRWTFFVAGD
ncbi:hypothetical protein [Mesorhizobium sp.]|jgi:hypothetical protein|uniref:hypothetical protein n=1 Tax=Mesorhizobium sp. TaxID=1871066 RepID=UPI0039C8F7FF